MANELELHFVVPEVPEQAIAHWKADPPGPLRGMELVDEAYNSLTFEKKYLDWPQKITMVMSLGVALLFKDFMTSQYKATVRFDPEGAMASRVTILGLLPSDARAELGAMADQSGGTTGLRVGA